jgi:hypothetical protein
VILSPALRDIIKMGLDNFTLPEFMMVLRSEALGG